MDVRLIHILIRIIQGITLIFYRLLQMICRQSHEKLGLPFKKLLQKQQWDKVTSASCCISVTSHLS